MRVLRNIVVTTAALLLGFWGRAYAVLPNWDNDLYCGDRTVIDLSELDLTKIPPGECWVVARVQPDPNSGGMEIARVHIDPHTGKQVMEMIDHPYCQLSGTIDVLAVLDAQPAQLHFRYLWRLAHLGDYTLYATLWSPFLTPHFGGTYLCPIRDLPDGPSRYSPVYIVPAEWVDYFKPALETLRAPREIPGAGPTVQHPEQLQGPIDAANPLIAIASFRRLAQSGRLSAETLDAAVSKATGVERSTIIFLALKYESPSNSASIEADIGRLIRESKSASELRGTALGIFAGLTLPQRVSQALQGTLKERLSDKTYQDDPMLRVTLRALNGIPPWITK